MPKNIKNQKSDTANTKKKTKRKPNYLVIAVLVVVLIPCLVLLYIILGSQEKQGEPVLGNRFEESFDPAISQADVTSLQTSLASDQADKISVSLRAGTLRITIDAQDGLNQDEITSLMNSVYDTTVEKFPVDTYFSNKNEGETVMKMYDLEVSAYNFIPQNDEEKPNQIHISRTKNAAAESDVVDVLTTPKDPETSEEILNPDTSQIPESEEGVEGE